MGEVECLHRARLLARYEIAVGDYAARLAEFRYLGIARTELLREHLDRLEDEITEHCTAHGCDPGWVKRRGR